MVYNLSLITSLYRSEQHLPDYIERINQVARELLEQNIRLQLVIIANDATNSEREYLDRIKQIEILNIKLLYVARETLYASWNRGIQVAEGQILGFWNVDDIRYTEAIVKAYHLLQDEGYDLVDMPYMISPRDNTKNILTDAYNPKIFSPKSCLSPFFMFTPNLIERVGLFNTDFQIAGDLEWCLRPLVRESRYQSLDVIGGRFILHENNLSNGTQPLEWVENNIILLWNKHYEQLRPVEPDLMREVWETWGYKNESIPENIANWLWGDNAKSQYLAYQRERKTLPLLRRIRLALARRGLWKSVEWDAHHKPKI